MFIEWLSSCQKFDFFLFYMKLISIICTIVCTGMSLSLKCEDGKRLTENVCRKMFDGKCLTENVYRKTLDGKRLMEHVIWE